MNYHQNALTIFLDALMSDNQGLRIEEGGHPTLDANPLAAAYYERETQTIFVAPGLKERNPGLHLCALCHEARHAYQHEVGALPSFSSLSAPAHLIVLMLSEAEAAMREAVLLVLAQRAGLSDDIPDRCKVCLEAYQSALLEGYSPSQSALYGMQQWLYHNVYTDPYLELWTKKKNPLGQGNSDIEGFLQAFSQMGWDGEDYPIDTVSELAEQALSLKYKNTSLSHGNSYR
jgi:hypothetical protein